MMFPQESQLPLLGLGGSRVGVFKLFSQVVFRSKRNEGNLVV